MGVTVGGRDVGLVGIGGRMSRLGGGIWLNIVCGLLLLVLSGIIGLMGGRRWLLILMLISTEG